MEASSFYELYPGISVWYLSTSTTQNSLRKTWNFSLLDSKIDVSYNPLNLCVCVLTVLNTTQAL